MGMLLLALSCSRQTEEKSGILRIGIASAVPTKTTVTGTSEENNVKSLQVFVYKKSGQDYVFEASANVTAREANISVTSGEKKIVAVVNCNAMLPSNEGADAVMDAASSFKDNSPDAFLMAGMCSFTVRPTSRSVAVPVSRVAARIKLVKLSNALQNGLEGKSFKLRRIYLTRTSSKSSLSGSVIPGDFYATSGIGSSLDLGGNAVTSADEKSSVNILMSKDVQSDNIPSGGSLNVDLPLYAYPNDGSVQKSRFVAEIQIDGKYYTYPIEFDLLKANNTYEIAELRIRSIGNPSNGDNIIEGNEDEPVEVEIATFGVDVQPWDIVTVANSDDGKYTI